MDIQMEKIFVVRMTRLEALRTLVAPIEFQKKLRESIDPQEGDGAEIVQGTVATPALGPGKKELPLPMSPLVRKAMRKLRKGSKLGKCPHCGKMFRGLNVHIARAHPDARGAQSRGDSRIAPTSTDS